MQALKVAEAQKHESDKTYAAFTSTIESFRASLVLVQTTLGKIEVAILGDEMNGSPGIVRRLRSVEEAVHGTQDAPGLAARLREVEALRERLGRYVILIAVLAATTGGGLGATLASFAKELAQFMLGVHS